MVYWVCIYKWGEKLREWAYIHVLHICMYGHIWTMGIWVPICLFSFHQWTVSFLERFFNPFISVLRDCWIRQFYLIFFFYKLPYLVKISNFLGNFYLCINSACTLKLFSVLQEVIFCLDITRKGIASLISVSINSTMIILLEEASILKFSC